MKKNLRLEHIGDFMVNYLTINNSIETFSIPVSVTCDFCGRKLNPSERYKLLQNTIKENDNGEEFNQTYNLEICLDCFEITSKHPNVKCCAHLDRISPCLKVSTKNGESIVVKEWIESIKADINAIQLTAKASMLDSPYIDTAIDCCGKTMERIEKAKNIF